MCFSSKVTAGEKAELVYVPDGSQKGLPLMDSGARQLLTDSRVDPQLADR